MAKCPEHRIIRPQGSRMVKVATRLDYQFIGLAQTSLRGGNLKNLKS
jgi:hypothetical protein